METFLYQPSLENIGKEGTFFKNPSKPSTIDLYIIPSTNQEQLLFPEQKNIFYGSFRLS